MGGGTVLAVEILTALLGSFYMLSLKKTWKVVRFKKKLHDILHPRVTGTMSVCIAGYCEPRYI
jgi:hypothetical protein